MTESEIMKALECCKKRNCGDCSYNVYGISCSNIIASDVLDLINRKNAEIERLQNRNKFLEIEFKNISNLFETRVNETKAEAIKELDERVKEATRKKFGSVNPYVSDVIDLFDQIAKEMGVEI